MTPSSPHRSPLSTQKRVHFGIAFAWGICSRDSLPHHFKELRFMPFEPTNAMLTIFDNGRNAFEIPLTTKPQQQEHHVAQADQPGQRSNLVCGEPDPARISAPECLDAMPEQRLLPGVDNDSQARGDIKGAGGCGGVFEVEHRADPPVFD